MAAITLDQLRKAYGGTTVVDGVSLSIGSGEFVTLLGPSGCGKTTTLRMIAGLVEPDGGTIAIGGREVTRTPVHERNIGMVFQSHALFPHMTVAENVGFGLRMRGLDKASRTPRVAAALDMVRLGPRAGSMPAELSGGQQQRVALARALVFDPDVLLLDEPFGALDRKLREIMQEELRDLTRRLGITAVFVTHDQDEALKMSDRIGVMNAGRIEQLGPPDEIFERPGTRFVADFMGFGNILDTEVTGAGMLTCGGLRIAADLPAGLSGAVTVAIRAERVDLTADASDGPNGANGTVVRASYQGTTAHYALRPDAAPQVLLHATNLVDPGGSPLRFRVGDRARATWPATAVRILANEPTN